MLKYLNITTVSYAQGLNMKFKHKNYVGNCLKVEFVLECSLQRRTDLTQLFLTISQKLTRKLGLRDTVPEIIDSGPMCITDLFQKKYLAYFNPK